MIGRFLALSGALALATPARALEFSMSADDDSPRTPTAAIVLGFTPEDIQQPGTPLDAVGALGTAASDAAGLPGSFALELMPYWLGTKAARDLDLRHYVNGGAQSLVQNLGVSVALDQQSSVLGDGDAEDLRAALGVRTALWGAPAAGTAQGRFAASWDRLFGTEIHLDGAAADARAAAASTPPTPTAAAKEDACAASLQQLSGFAAWLNAQLAAKVKATQSKNLAAVDSRQAEALALCDTVNAALYPKSGKACVDAHFLPAGTGALPTDDAATAAKLKTILDALAVASAKASADLDAEVKTLLKAAASDPKTVGDALASYLGEVGFENAFDECGEMLERREGFVLELAGGVGVLSPDQTLAETEMSDWSVWAAPGWVGDRWSATLLGRLRASALYDSPTLSFDAGGGVGYKWPAVTIGLQGIYGIPIQGDSPTAKVVVTDDIRITNSVWFSTAFGGTFPADEPGSFLSFLSIKFASDKQATLKTPGPTEMSALLVADQ